MLCSLSISIKKQTKQNQKANKQTNKMVKQNKTKPLRTLRFSIGSMCSTIYLFGSEAYTTAISLQSGAKTDKLKLAGVTGDTITFSVQMQSATENQEQIISLTLTCIYTQISAINFLIKKPKCYLQTLHHFRNKVMTYAITAVNWLTTDVLKNSIKEQNFPKELLC